MVFVFAGLGATVVVTEAIRGKYVAANRAVDWLTVVGVEMVDELGDAGKGGAVVERREGTGEGVVVSGNGGNVSR